MICGDLPEQFGVMGSVSGNREFIPSHLRKVLELENPHQQVGASAAEDAPAAALPAEEAAIASVAEP